MKEVKKYRLVPWEETSTNMVETNIEATNQSLSEDIILLSIPKVMQNKAKALLEYLQHIPSITWNEIGEVVLDNEVISGSHISDLVKRCVFPHKSFHPIGLDSFYSVLLKSNIRKGLLVPIDQTGYGGIRLPPPGIPLKPKHKEWIKL